jgi:hypothetical protein
MKTVDKGKMRVILIHDRRLKRLEDGVIAGLSRCMHALSHGGVVLGSISMWLAFGRTSRLLSG